MDAKTEAAVRAVESLEGFDDLYGADPELETHGARMDVPGKPGWWLQLRSQHSSRVLDAAALLERKYAGLYQAKQPIPAESRKQDRINLFATEIVVAWGGDEGVTAWGGLPCLPATVKAVMIRYPSFLDLADRWSSDRSNYRQGTREAEVKALGESAPTA